MSEQITLPPLPEREHDLHTYLAKFSDRQMVAYARAAVLADRAASDKDAERYRWLRGASVDRGTITHDNWCDVIERAQLWLDEAHRRGINVTDENGYLAVISDLVSEVEFQRTALQGYRNEQERLIDQCDRAWKEVDAIAKERDDHHRWRQELADDLGKAEKTRDVLARTVNDQERELGLLRAVRDAAADLCDDAEEYECEALGLFAQHGSWEPLHDALEAVRPCTCHPDDNPPVPCPRKFALSECRAAAPSFDWQKSCHYTAENIAAMVADLKAVEDGIESIEWMNRDHRTRAGILWRVIQALSHEIPTAAAPAEPQEPVAWAYYWPDGGLCSVDHTRRNNLGASITGDLREVPLYARPFDVAEAMRLHDNALSAFDRDGYNDAYAAARAALEACLKAAP